MTRSALAAALLLVPPLSGCLGGPAPVERYRLTPVQPEARAAAAPAGATMLPTVTVEPYATAGIYADPGIVYRLEESSYGAYPNREWALPLGTMLADATIEAMRAVPGLAARVTSDGTAVSEQLVWRGVVQQFEEVNRGDSVSAAVRLDAALVWSPGDSIVWQGTAGLERPVADPTMPAIVRALSELTAEAVRRLVTDGRGALATDTVRLSEAR
jgi:ABC-type uncharacterized transport system auxiliary subunit